MFESSSATDNIQTDTFKCTVESNYHMKGTVNVSSMNEAMCFIETYIPVIDNSPDMTDPKTRTWVKASTRPIVTNIFESKEDAWEFARVLDQVEQHNNTIYIGEVIHDNSKEAVYAYYYRNAF
jgi:hypothetical protein